MIAVNSVGMNAGALRVLIVARVSSPGHCKQDPRSVEDQEALVRDWIARNIDEPCEIEVLAGSGSGENLDRKEFLELTDMVAARKYDLIVTEDLGRIVRRLRAHMFAEECVDNDVRLVAINDHIDTAERGWQDRSIFSSWHHEWSNRDTSDRIKRTHRARFQNGGCAAIPIYGYIKPPGSKSDMDWQKDPAAEPIYREWFERLDRGESFAEIADWLNELGIATSPYCRSERWTGSFVAQVTRNTLLKGRRFRNRRVSKRDSRGKYRSLPADPDQLLTREVPHLAFIEPVEYDRILAKIDRRNTRYRRGTAGRDDRRGVPRKRTRFPGQITYCGICGRSYVFGGQGKRERMMCSGAKEHRCWNGATFDAPLAARRVSALVMDVFQELPEFDEAFLAEVNVEANRLDAERSERLAKIETELRQIEQRIGNLVDAIANGRDSPAVAEALRQLEQRQQALQRESAMIERQPQNRVEIPSATELRELARSSCAGLADDDWEFCKRMQQLVPKVVVHPYQLCDGGTVVLRAEFRIDPAAIIAEPRCRELLSEPLGTRRMVDLFEPPQRAAFRDQVVELRTAGLSFRQIAARLGITMSAVQAVAEFDRMVSRLGLADPYIPVTVPRESYSRLKRYQHPRYQFEPLSDAGRL